MTLRYFSITYCVYIGINIRHIVNPQPCYSYISRRRISAQKICGFKFSIAINYITDWTFSLALEHWAVFVHSQLTAAMDVRRLARTGRRWKKKKFNRKHDVQTQSASNNKCNTCIGVRKILDLDCSSSCLFVKNFLCKLEFFHCSLIFQRFQQEIVREKKREVICSANSILFNRDLGEVFVVSDLLK